MTGIITWDVQGKKRPLFRRKVVETITVTQLQKNSPAHPYTKQLLRASHGYDRSALESLEGETPFSDKDGV